MDYQKPTNYRISTITATGSVGTLIDLNILYDNLETIELDDKSGIVYAEYGNKKSETFYKGYSKKFHINKRKNKPSKRFDNQVTIVYRVSEFQSLNIKTFRNGNLQITGIKDIDNSSYIIDIIIDIIKNIYNTKDKNIVDNIDNLKNDNFRIRLINTDYKIGFMIKRENLYNMIKKEYLNICNYEPCIYPGVKIQYFYNKSNVLNDGVCRCTDSNCSNLKKNDESHCKKITIAIFQSGCIIITGSQTRNQINECYAFINNILYSNVHKIEKKNMLPCLDKSIPEKKIILLPKSKIKSLKTKTN